MWALLQVGLSVSAATVAAGGPDEDDPRVRAFAEAYAPFIDAVTHQGGDIVFTLRGRAIHFQDGRMLGRGRLGEPELCDPIFYEYSLEPLTQPPPAAELPTYCTDVAESLWGRTEGEIRRHGRSATFLGHRMFLNEVVLRPLAAVEADILQLSRRDPPVAQWMEQLDVTYSFIVRDIAATQTPSYHGWGLAIDLVPTSYEGRQVYWRWSSVFDREGWHEIPVEQRWSPPESVVAAFERHGFVWGGKWSHFDTIHFEYRPEIILYNRLIGAR
jgi:hypothetical protein